MKMLKNMKDIIDDIKEIAGYIWDFGWAERNGGNFSIDISDRIKGNYEGYFIKEKFMFPYLEGRYFIFKKKGSRFREVAKRPMENIVIAGLCKKRLKIIYGEEPTSEIKTHLILHNYLRKVESKNYAILHTHPEYTLALSTIKNITEKKLNKMLLNLLPEMKIFIRDVGFLNYEEPGSFKLAYGTLKKSKKNNIIIWERHGTCVIDENIKEAFDKTHILEKAAKIAIINYILNLRLTF